MADIKIHKTTRLVRFVIAVILGAASGRIAHELGAIEPLRIAIVPLTVVFVYLFLPTRVSWGKSK